MERYIILRRPSRNAAGSAYRGLEMLGAGTGADITLAGERLSLKDAASIALEPEVEAVTPVMPTRLIKPLMSEGQPQISPWGLEATGATSSRYTGRGTRVAVLDTGIDASHPAFKGVSIDQMDFSGDGDGDRQGHGTHCAGIFFGRTSDPRIGVAPGISEAFIGKVLKDRGDGDSEMIFAGMQWALSKKADIISMSLGFDFPGMVARLVADKWPPDLATSNALEAYRGNLRMFDAIMQLTRARGGLGGGALVFAAAGNESRRDDDAAWRIAASLPAAAEDVVSVAAVGRKGDMLGAASFSNIKAVIAGPGVDITSAWPGGGLHTISGTSMACPHVAGLAALWWEAVRDGGRRPSPMNVRSALVDHASRSRLGEHPDEADFGQGLAMAP